MGVKGQDLIACLGGFGSYVTRGEQRVSEMEHHAMLLRERVDRLQSMLPSVMIEASIAVQKGEEAPDLLKLIGKPEDLVNTDGKLDNEGIAKHMFRTYKIMHRYIYKWTETVFFTFT